MVSEKTEKTNMVFAITVVIYIVLMFVDLPFINGYLFLILTQFLLFLPVIIHMWKNKEDARDILKAKPMRVSNYIWLFIFSFTIKPVLTLISSISLVFASDVASQTMIDIVLDAPLALSIVAIALIPALFEETAYRGLYFNTYRRTGVLKGMLVSSALFALLHANLNQFSYAFVMGLMFVLLIEATDSIVSSVFVHLLINLSSVLQIYVFPRLIMFMEFIYRESVDSGDFGTARWIEEFFGGTDFSIDSLVNSQGTVRLTLSDAISTFLPSAILFGLISFFIFRKIARNAGKWDHIRDVFSRRAVRKERGASEGRTIVMDDGDNDVFARETVTIGMDGGGKILTMPLVVAVVMMVFVMALVEFVL